MTRYLLDTNIVSDLVRNPQGAVTAQIARVGEANVATSIIVAAELRFGVRKRGSAALARQVEAVLEVLPVLPFEEAADSAYAELRHALEVAGTPIGANDMLIAAHAIALDMTLVSANRRECERVAGLQVIDWLTV